MKCSRGARNERIQNQISQGGANKCGRDPSPLLRWFPNPESRILHSLTRF